MTPQRRGSNLSTLAAATLTMPACWAMSIHPLWLADEAHPFDARVTGNWLQRDGDCRWEITALNGEYHAAYTTQASEKKPAAVGENPVAEFNGYAVTIDGSLLLDLVPVNVITNNPQLVTGHVFYRVAVKDQALELVPLNAEFVIKAIERGEISGRVDHEHWADCAVITSSTEEIRKFVAAHAHHVAAFTDVDDRGNPYWHFEPLQPEAKAKAKGAGACKQK